MKISNFIVMKKTESVNLQLSEEEIKTRSVTSIKKLREINILREQFKTIVQDWRNKIKTLEQEFRDLNIIIEKELELKEVEGERVYDIKKNLTWFSYRGVKYDERNITDKELENLRQGTIEDFN
jgi:hypothetical protein